MKLTIEELICINSLCGGKEINGIATEIEIENEDSFVKEVQESLVEKGILDKEKHFTEAGKVLTGLIKEYQEAKQHLVINDMHIALLSGQKAAILRKEEGGVEIHYNHRAAIVYGFIQQNPTFRNKRKRFKIPERIEMSYKEIEKSLEDYKGENVLYMQKAGKEEFRRLYYWEEEKAYEYDLIKGIREATETGEIRVIMAELLEAEVEQNG